MITALIEMYKVLCKQQHGLLLLIEAVKPGLLPSQLVISQNWCDGQCDILPLDFCEAFDKVLHTRLWS